MNDFSSRRKPSSGARFLQRCAVIVSIVVVVLFVPLYAAAANLRMITMAVPDSLQVVLLALLQTGLLVALWRAYALRRWGCAVLGICAWLTAVLGMITVALIPIAAVTGIAFFMVLVEEWPHLQSGF